MTIQKNTYEQIIKVLPEHPPEFGGLLGGKDSIICATELDYGIPGEMCGYAPDVYRLNNVIKKWRQEGIYFMGIFHTHFFHVRTLSEPDKKYIIEILNSMPERITMLYFPVAVLPEREIVPYIAVRQNPDVLIQEDKLIILQEDDGNEECRKN